MKRQPRRSTRAAEGLAEYRVRNGADKFRCIDLFCGIGGFRIAFERAGGTRPSPLPDFNIGAHAEAEGLTLVTRDVARFRRYFPAVQLIAP